MLAIADGDNKGEEYWEDVLIEKKKWSNKELKFIPSVL
jgi:hypothetical protein